MTVDERFEQFERKIQRLEKRNKRLTVPLTMMAVAICAVVTMAATNIRDVGNSENGRFEFHSDSGPETKTRYYMLDSKTGDLFEVYGGNKKKPVELDQ